MIELRLNSPAGEIGGEISAENQALWVGCVRARAPERETQRERSQPLQRRCNRRGVCNSHPSAMHAAATFGRLHHAPLASTAFLNGGRNGECCSSSSREVRVRSRFGGQGRDGVVVVQRGRRWRAGARREGEQRLPVGEYGERIVVASYDDEGGASEDIKLECDESGCVIVKTTSKTLEEEDDRGAFLCCDLTGGAEVSRSWAVGSVELQCEFRGCEIIDRVGFAHIASCGMVDGVLVVGNRVE